MAKLRYFIILFAVLPLFFSCASVAELKVAPSGDVTVNLSIKPTKNMQAIAKNLDGDVTTLLDKDQLTQNLKTENIQTVNFSAESFAAISGSFKIPSERVQASQLFNIDLNAKTVGCNISKGNLAPLLATFPQDVKDYLELFFSPITTGENMTAEEYEALIATAYGPTIANELKTSFFKVVLSCPGTIDTVKSEPEGRVRYFAENTATLTIPLAYMLSLEKPLTITVTYK